MCLGDFNFVESIIYDKIGGNPNKGDIRLNEINIIKNDFDLVDVHSNTTSSKIFTWTSANNMIKCRLDRFYVSKSIKQYISNVNMVSSILLSHNCVFGLSLIQNHAQLMGHLIGNVMFPFYVIL